MKHKVFWLAWTLVLVIGVSLHYGPGQELRTREHAATLLASAADLQRAAEAVQQRAAGLSEIRAAARRQAQASGAPEDIDSAARAIAEEELAWKDARAAWTAVAEVFGEAQSVLAEVAAEEAAQVRLQRDRALIGAGQAFGAASDLEQLLSELDAGGQGDGPLARQVRAEIGTAYYIGARTMRLEGKPDTEWRRVSALARQQFRYLAEQPATTAAAAAARATHQNNLEVVLNLEQCTLDELEASPTPCSNCRDSNCWGQRPNRPTGDKDPADGGGDYDIDLSDGW